MNKYKLKKRKYIATYIYLEVVLFFIILLTTNADIRIITMYFILSPFFFLILSMQLLSVDHEGIRKRRTRFKGKIDKDKCNIIFNSYYLTSSDISYVNTTCDFENNNCKNDKTFPRKEFHHSDWAMNTLRYSEFPAKNMEDKHIAFAKSEGYCAKCKHYKK